MILKDKIIFSIFITAFFLSIIFRKPMIAQIAGFFYSLLFIYEFSNYIRDKKNTGIVWKHIGMYEDLYGRFFVKILFSITILFVFSVAIFSIYKSFAR